MTGPQEPIQVGSLLFFNYHVSASFVPGTVPSALCLLSHWTPHHNLQNEYYYTSLANEETKPQKQGHPIHCAVTVHGNSISVPGSRSAQVLKSRLKSPRSILDSSPPGSATNLLCDVPSGLSPLTCVRGEMCKHSEHWLQTRLPGFDSQFFPY